MIKFQSYLIKNNLLTNQILEVYISKFWDDVFTAIKDGHHLMLMCKVEFNDSELGYRTLGELRRVNFEDKKGFIYWTICRRRYCSFNASKSSVAPVTFIIWYVWNYFMVK